MTKTILVAKATLQGGVLAKDGVFTAFSLNAGEEITKDHGAKLGLTEGEIEKLLLAGAVDEVKVRTSDQAEPAKT